MTPERWQQIKGILAAVLDKNVEERLQFLDVACQGDEFLGREVRSLLAAYGEAGSFLEHPKFRLLSEEPTNLWEGAVLDRYRLIRRLGHGGMGTVYLAHDNEFHRQVAVKLLRWQIDEDLVQRFRVERQILARLDHPNIARLYDGGAVEGRPYFVMEYVEGEPIGRYCDSRRLSVRDRLELFRTVCLAVHFAHQNLVVHRDLKPSNILVTPQGEPKLLDFGIAKILASDSSALTNSTITGLRPMTPDYASPEQIRGDPVATTSDIYSLGVVLYELLTGRRPYLLKSHLLEEVVRVVLQEEPEKPSAVVAREVEIREDDGIRVTLSPEAVSGLREEDPGKLRRQLAGDVDNIVLMALRKEPERRYSSAAQLSEDLRRHLEALPVLARKDTFDYRAGKFIQRNKLTVAAASLALLLAFGFLVGLFLQQQRTLRERDRAERIAEFLIEIFKISDPSQSRGKTVTAREILDQGAQKIERQLADQPEAQATMLNTLGEVYASLGLYERAQSLLENALVIRQRTLSRESLEVAETMGELAIVLRARGDFDRAEAAFRESLRLHRKILGSDDPRVATAANNLAGALIAIRNDTAGAEPLAREALEIRRRHYPRDHHLIANSLMTLAELHRIRGNYRHAEPLYREAIDMCRRLYQGDHPDSADSLHNLGVALIAQGRYGEAEAYLRDALAMRTRLLGLEHRKVANTRNELALALAERGEYGKAEPLMREVLSVRTKVLGSRHPDVAISLMSLSVLYQDLGRYPEAESLSRQALSLWRDLLGEEHSTVATSRENVAVLLLLQGKYDEAERLYGQVLAMRRRLLGDKHPDVAVTLDNLGVLALRQGRYEVAEGYLRKATALRREVLGGDHPHLAGSLTSLSNALAGRQKYGEAGSAAREAIRILRRSNPAGHWKLDAAESALGNSLVGQGRYEEAEPILLRSYRHTAGALGTGSPQARRIRERILRLYEAWGRPEKAAPFRALVPDKEQPPGGLGN